MGESTKWFKATQTQNFLSPFFLHWVHLSHSTHKQPPKLKKSQNSTTMGNFQLGDSEKQLVNQKSLYMCSLLLSVPPPPAHSPPHTPLFSAQHYHKHYFKKCLWTEPCNTSRQQKWKIWLSKEAAAKQASSASLWLTGSLHCTRRATVKVTAGWQPALVHVEQVGTVKAGRASFSFLYSRKFIFMKRLRLFTKLTWSLVTDLFTGQKQDCTWLQKPENTSCGQTTFSKPSCSLNSFS